MEQVEAQQRATLHLVDDAAPYQGAYGEMLNLNQERRGRCSEASNVRGQGEAFLDIDLICIAESGTGPRYNSKLESLSPRFQSGKTPADLCFRRK
jgi:hypothetical protein